MLKGFTEAMLRQKVYYMMEAFNCDCFLSLNYGLISLVGIRLCVYKAALCLTAELDITIILHTITSILHTITSISYFFLQFNISNNLQLSIIIQTSLSLIKMAIDNAERHGQRGDDYSSEPGYAVQTENTADFFEAIASGQEGLVNEFIEQNPEISNTPNEHGETPLIAAVRADKLVIVRDLIWGGAKVNVFANYSQQGQTSQTLRTPLQVAATEGKLHMISALRENRADVFLVAPDGFNALQLATNNGHESVVDHIQRAYAGTIGSPCVAPNGVTPDSSTDATEVCSVDCQRSVKDDPTQHVQERHEKSLSCITWAIPKFILDKTPTTIISAITNVLVDNPKEIQQCRKNVKLWCQEQIQEFSTRVKRGTDLADRRTKEAVELVTKTPERAWQLMKRAPNAIWTIMLCIGTMLRKLGGMAPYLLKQMTTAVQIIVKAVASIFKAATLHGIKGGVSTISQTVFKELSKGLLGLVARLRQTSHAVLQTAVGSLTKAIIIFAALTLGICILFSKRTWGLLRAPEKLAKKGVREILELMGLQRM